LQGEDQRSEHGPTVPIDDEMAMRDACAADFAWLAGQRTLQASRCVFGLLSPTGLEQKRRQHTPCGHQIGIEINGEPRFL